MGVQDLGALGEFISSLVIVVTLMVLIYEVRGAKQATMRANAQEQPSKRDDVNRGFSEPPDLGLILETANQYLGRSRSEVAAEFGLEADQYWRLNTIFNRLLAQWRAAYVSDLPEEERAVMDLTARIWFSEPALAKWYDLNWRGPREGDFGDFLQYLDRIKTSLEGNA